MAVANTGIDPIALNKIQLDPSFYQPYAKQATFFKQHIGGEITDEELKRHILAVQAMAYEIFRFPCIFNFSFLKLHVSTIPIYSDVVKLGQERDGAIFLDLGCCFGVDARKLAFDGYPGDNIVAIDIHKEFLDLGHKLFKSSPETCPIHFATGDLTDSKFLPANEILLEAPSSPRPSLDNVNSLAPFHGHASAIYIASVFHLFNEADQCKIAHRVGALLSPQPGSIIFGTQLSQEQQGKYPPLNIYGNWLLDLHSESSWTQLWTNEVFKGLNVEFKTQLVDHGGDHPLMNWSLRRL